MIAQLNNNEETINTLTVTPCIIRLKEETNLENVFGFVLPLKVFLNKGIIRRTEMVTKILLTFICASLSFNNVARAHHPLARELLQRGTLQKAVDLKNLKQNGNFGDIFSSKKKDVVVSDLGNKILKVAGNLPVSGQSIKWFTKVFLRVLHLQSNYTAGKKSYDTPDCCPNYLINAESMES